MKDRIKVFVVCVILPIALIGDLVYEAIPEYKKNPAEIHAMILLLFISLTIFYYFWSNYHGKN